MVKKTNPYIPDRYDIILINLYPQAGSEITKRRPCLVLTPKSLNQAIKKCYVIPVTNTPPKLATHIPLPLIQKKATGTLIVEQLRSVDFISRKASKFDVLFDKNVYQRLCSIVNTLITG